MLSRETVWEEVPPTQFSRWKSPGRDASSPEVPDYRDQAQERCGGLVISAALCLSSTDLGPGRSEVVKEIFDIFKNAF
jgi:hypothetical protein